MYSLTLVRVDIGLVGVGCYCVVSKTVEGFVERIKYMRSTYASGPKIHVHGQNNMWIHFLNLDKFVDYVIAIATVMSNTSSCCQSQTL